jgi:hypothetical protein
MFGGLAGQSVTRGDLASGATAGFIGLATAVPDHCGDNGISNVKRSAKMEVVFCIWLFSDEQKVSYTYVGNPPQAAWQAGEGKSSVGSGLSLATAQNICKMRPQSMNPHERFDDLNRTKLMILYDTASPFQ